MMNSALNAFSGFNCNQDKNNALQACHLYTVGPEAYLECHEKTKLDYVSCLGARNL